MFKILFSINLPYRSFDRVDKIKGIIVNENKTASV